MHEEITINSNKREQLIDITDHLNSILSKSKVKTGILHVYVPHSTAGIIINENYDPNICDDVLDALKKVAPKGVWRHDKIDGNADAHIKASIIGPSETIPFKDNKLLLGNWQSAMLADFDGPKQRKLIITIWGE